MSAWTRSRRWLAIAAGAVLLGLALALTASWVLRDTSPQYSDQARTGATERRKLTLPDGSTVALNRNTALAITYFARRRHVALVRGEAFFHVRWQRRVAFEVSNGQESVEIVGTRVQVPDTLFNVRATPGALQVQVQSGSLKVRTATAGPREFVEMRAGDSLTLQRGQLHHELTRVDPAEVGAWVAQR
ncbi:MAG TPA: FecR domain-containing protein [Bordetella sp.]|nr:FecR domain-containing protein [Bordetella sp.]